MIFINKEKKESFKEEFKILAQHFPHSFNEKGALPNARPIIVESAKNVRPVALFRPNQTDAPIRFKKPKEAQHKVSASGNFHNEEGFSVSWHYATKYPDIKAGEKIFKREYINLSIPQALDPTTDIEKIMVLFFYSPDFTNNAVAEKTGKGKNANFRFNKPEEKALARIREEEFKTKYSAILMTMATRVPTEMFKELCDLLNYVGTGVEDQDRVSMYDTVIADSKFRERFDKIVGMLQDNRKGVEESLNHKTLVAKARAAKVLVIEDNMWVTKDVNGLTLREVAEVVGEKQPEKDANLVQYLSASSDDAEHIASLIA